MKLTKIQLKLLRNYQRLQADSLTLRNIVRFYFVSWFLLLIGAVIGYWFTTAGMPAFGWLLVGMCAGTLLRDIGRIQISFRTWPVLREIINWDRVKNLIETHDSGADA